VPVPIELRRRGYRLAYRLLRVYWFIRRPHTHGVKCVLSDGENVLLVRHTYGPDEWELPGGGRRRHESPVSAARREILEELGIAIDAWTELGRISGRLHHRRNTLDCFQAELSAPVLTLDRVEIAAASWFPRGALPPTLGRYVEPILAQADP
jgi:8-oxo-dGTP pyrophosphatase MutT (NUDIX family)